jgi:hypothetical protein
MSNFAEESWSLSDYETREELEQEQNDLDRGLSILRGYMRGVEEKLRDLPEDDEC